MRSYDAILLDLDGTLVGADGTIHPFTREALRTAHARGVRVLVATGRSSEGTLPVLEQLGLDEPAVVYNGAGIYCPRERRLIEERVLSNRAVERTLAFAERHGLLTVVMRPGEKYGLAPRDPFEEAALRWMEDLTLLDRAALPRETLVRITVFGHAGRPSERLFHDLEAEVDLPLFLTHFPLSCLAEHRDSPLGVVDVQPPCRGKAEALRYLEETYGIPAARVVAVGDASNDVEMLAGAGLGVTMEVAMPEAIAVADRRIGSCDSDAIGRLVEELFLDGRAAG